MENQEFKRIEKYVRKYGDLRSERALKAARLVLVNDLTKADAARVVGLTPQSVSKFMQRLQSVLDDAPTEWT